MQQVLPSDGDKLRLLALWFDLWDHPATDRQALLDDPRHPGRNEVQLDLRRMAILIDGIRSEFQRFYDFVGDHDPALVDAWHFGENVRVQQEARDASSAAPD